ncbi:lasso peptide biosynthesis B2 protein [Roseobacter sp. YSTF-M11]|uniref:Lasso peptide biosynthesis B2 protein n=1 Tax=Roseobacter insulae TaxID=2859783 RepID=A0A9X1FY88_9RHOB|nr:lasso peptide biosynthesis B2 protein [Roseobacter insulae]MBW4709959.1 lasso peptide biosynthesis B2 protein [Roseobacter insulae]
MLYLAENVHFAEVEDCGVLLDMRQDAYHFLDPRNCAAFVQALRAEATENDVSAACLAQRLLSRTRPQPQPQSHPAPARRASVFSALTTMRQTTRCHRKDGILACWAQSNRAPATKLRATGGIDHAVNAFLRAENLFDFGRSTDDCLLRSLSLQRYLRQAGYDSRHVIGVKIYPFNAHAWVEYADQPLLNDAEDIAPYTRILVG